jgi:uncharacterized membrane protein YphA (DoxX/SURF4 family)
VASAGGRDDGAFRFEPVGVAAFCVSSRSNRSVRLCIALGFLTRFWAAALATEMAVISLVQTPNGYPRVEQFLLWGFLAFVVALGGGGRCSINRSVGWEL